MWEFRKMGRDEVNQDPTADYFFNVEALENLSDALIRESIQNSLDAKPNNASGPVLVRITIPKSDVSISSADAQAYFGGLWPHLKSIPDLERRPSEDEPVSWILVEDFGTRGLEGDVTESDDPPENVRNDFYYFWRNVGRGKKTGDDRGRWGLGKTMFPASSRINTFLGYTVRESDAQPLLMGQSVLRIHKIKGTKHYPFGYFGTPDPEDRFITPITSREKIDHFRATFSLTRSTEPGLSIVIPFPHEGFGKSELTHSVIHHYFFPIINRELVVEVGEGASYNRITADNIDEIINDIEGTANTIGPFLELARIYLATKNDQLMHTKLTPAGRAPLWNEEKLTPEKLDGALKLLDEHKPVCFRVPVCVYPVGKNAVESHFDVLLLRSPELEKAEDIYIRQGITISGEHSLREPGVRALLVASDSAVASFLGDAENPAHTEWQEKSKKFKGKYNAGNSTLKFIKSAPQGLMNILNRRSEKIDDTILRHIFPTSGADGSPNREPAERIGNPTRSAPPVTPKVRRPSSYSLNKTDGGFSITLTEHGRLIVPFMLRIRCAYDLARGNPFKKWAEEDFVLGEPPLELAVNGGKVLGAGNNTCEIEVNAAEFRLSISGFDHNRDIIVDVRIEELADA